MSVVLGNSKIKVRRQHSKRWATFERRFHPLPAPGHDVLWEAAEIPTSPDARYWWTVLDCDGRLYVVPGFWFVNRFAYVRCAKPWTEADVHTEYRYD
jgi:hypothetical protein